MLFITNRFPTQSIRTRHGRNFTFDLKNNAPSNSVFFCERRATGDYEEIGSIPLLNRLKDSRYRQILIFIHGFSNLPEDAFAKALTLQRLCDEAKPDEALVLPIVWPCDNGAGLVQDYWDDQHAADMSAYSLRRVCDKFVAWQSSPQLNPESDPCLKRINVLAHSMGNRVLRETMAAWNHYDLPHGVPMLFRNAFLVAADIVNETLEVGNKGEFICDASRNVTVYHAADDLALRASKVVNLRHGIASRRLGQTGPEDLAVTPKNVYAVDCDDVNTEYDWPTGHAHFLTVGDTPKAGVVFDHMFASLVNGRVFPDDDKQRTLILREATPQT